MDLNTPIKEASRSYKMFAKRLEKLGIKKVEDFLFHIPFRYENYSLISKINRVQQGETVTIKGTVKEIKNEFTSRWKKIQRAIVEDETGELEIIWFNQPYLLNILKPKSKISVSGKIGLFRNKKTILSPEYELIYNEDDDLTIHTGRLVPVYPETRGVSSKWLRRQVFNILKINKDKIEDFLPEEIKKENDLTALKNALFNIHFPKKAEDVNIAKKRLSFDELFVMQLNSLIRKKSWSSQVIKKPFKIDCYNKEIENFINNLPFELTTAQKRVIKEIFKDFSLKKPMNRLLEGDVGSGKTIIAAISIYVAYLNGYQSLLMAPTEILASQHYNTIHNLLSNFGVKVELCTSSSKNKNNASGIKHHEGIQNRKCKILNTDVLVGTHAILYSKFVQKNIGFVVIDEQQRFGVEQRSILRKMGQNPHTLTMTATPIPRTIALTMYGDLDLSFLDEMPKGRKKIKTWLVPLQKRENAYKWIQDEITKNKSQVFIICPLIEESENLKSIKAVTKEYDWLRDKIFPKLKIGLLHGRMKTKEKDETLKKFKNKKFDILVSTPVVEVGIDIPNATIMLIEQSERFGLSQLHQLRGRVGRGDKQSYCLLFTSSKNEKTIERLKSMEKIDFGPELAELDLKLRGPGQLYGTLQHGIPALKIASFSDFDLIRKTKKEAEKIIDKLNKYPRLKEKIEQESNQNISPD